MAAAASPTTESRLAEIEQKFSELKTGLLGELGQIKEALASVTKDRDSWKEKFETLVADVDAALEKHSPSPPAPSA